MKIRNGVRLVEVGLKVGKEVGLKVGLKIIIPILRFVYQIGVVAVQEGGYSFIHNNAALNRSTVRQNCSRSQTKKQL